MELTKFWRRASSDVDFGYNNATIARGCPHNDPLIGWDVQVPLLTSVTQPDGSSYQMPVANYPSVDRFSPACKSSGASAVDPAHARWPAVDLSDYVFPAAGKDPSPVSPAWRCGGP